MFLNTCGDPKAEIKHVPTVLNACASVLNTCGDLKAEIKHVPTVFNTLRERFEHESPYPDLLHAKKMIIGFRRARVQRLIGETNGFSNHLRIGMTQS